MNRDHRGILVGMVLGDGYIRPGSKGGNGKKAIACQITISHCEKQKEYAEHKNELLRTIFGGVHKVHEHIHKDKDEKIIRKTYHISKSNSYFRILRRMLYPNGKKQFSVLALKMLTEHGIALWFMDDGSTNFQRGSSGNISGVEMRLSTYCSLEEAENIMEYFDETYGIQAGKRFCKKTGLYYIKFNTDNSRKLTAMIEPYMIDCMRYKVDSIANQSRHECPASELRCMSCHKVVERIARKGKCWPCYQKEWKDDKYGDDRFECPSCGKSSLARWRVDGECRYCYTKHRKQMVIYAELTGSDTVRS